MTKTWKYGEGWIDTNNKPVKSDSKEDLEKLNIEFVVERTVNYPYEYQEKYLRFNDKRTRYKAIVQRGILAGIVGRFYKLIPNEDVITMLKKISYDKRLVIQTITYDWRIYTILLNPENNVGVLVSNSVDGTIALRVDALVKKALEDSYSVLVGTKIKNIYRKHSKNLTVKELSEEIDEIYEVALNYKDVLKKLDNYKLEDYFDGIKGLLEKKLPEVYTQGLFYRGLTIGKPISTLKDVYENVSNRIWKRNTDIRTKINLYRILNDAVMSLGIAIEL